MHACRSTLEDPTADRGRRRRSYATPYIIAAEKGDQIVINSEERIDAYDAERGELLWYIGDRSQAVVPTPVWHAGILYSSRGYTSGPYFALETKAGMRGDAAPNVKWEMKTGAPYVSSLLYYAGIVYMAIETGVAAAVDAGDGHTLWKDRLGGVFSASPVEADGKIYMLNEDGEMVVLAAGREKKILARNKLDERMLASPAISGGQIFVRGDDHLFCIGPRSAATAPGVNQSVAKRPQ